MTTHDDLPIKDFDHLQVGGLTSRIRSLDAGELQTLLTYEQGHANRFQVVQIMKNRLSSLKAGAQPSGGDPAATGADAPPSAGDPTDASEPGQG